MKKLSIALATYNEEKNINRCLSSVQDIADEIVIVDGTSSDRTVEIAKEFKAKITITDNPLIFHINKQKAIDKCTSEWILQLDADEVVGRDLRKEIKEIIEMSSDINGYWLPRKNYFLGRFLLKGGQYPDYTLRLYKRGKGRLPQKDVHEQAEVEGTVGYLKESLLHYPYENFSSYLRKWRTYNTILASQIRTSLKNKSLLYKFFIGLGYIFVKPVHWFLLTYIRHKGFMDSWQGFVFSFYSSLRYPFAFIEYITK